MSINGSHVYGASLNSAIKERNDALEIQDLNSQIEYFETTSLDNTFSDSNFRKSRLILTIAHESRQSRVSKLSDAKI
jgi:hypothetical protein